MSIELSVTNDPSKLAELDILSRLDEIEQGLLNGDPKIPVHVMSIHKTLKQFEELVHILPDEKVMVLVKGYQHYKKMKIMEEATAKKGPGRKALNRTTIDDI